MLANQVEHPMPSKSTLVVFKLEAQQQSGLVVSLIMMGHCLKFTKHHLMETFCAYAGGVEMLVQS
jgi:hypothetical protein